MYDQLKFCRNKTLPYFTIKNNVILLITTNIDFTKSRYNKCWKESIQSYLQNILISRYKLHDQKISRFVSENNIYRNGSYIPQKLNICRETVELHIGRLYGNLNSSKHGQYYRNVKKKSNFMNMNPNLINSAKMRWKTRKEINIFLLIENKNKNKYLNKECNLYGILCSKNNSKTYGFMNGIEIQHYETWNTTNSLKFSKLNQRKRKISTNPVKLYQNLNTNSFELPKRNMRKRSTDKINKTEELPAHKRTSVQYSSLVGPSFVNMTFNGRTHALAGQTARLNCLVKNLHNYTVSYEILPFVLYYPLLTPR